MPPPSILKLFSQVGQLNLLAGFFLGSQLVGQGGNGVSLVVGSATKGHVDDVHALVEGKFHTLPSSSNGHFKSLCKSRWKLSKHFRLR